MFRDIQRHSDGTPQLTATRGKAMSENAIKGRAMTLRRITIAIAPVSLAAWLFGCATTRTPPIVPDSLKTPPNQLLVLETRATGVQIYECRAGKDNAARFEWVLVAPEAELIDNAGVKVGKHYAGPTWEAIDGSKVVGEVKARDDGPDPNAIPWLLLTAKSTSGSGMLNKTTSIQRLATSGGKAPAACGKDDAGKQARVPYEAVYNFYVAQP
jgi:hypothetical protein